MALPSKLVSLRLSSDTFASRAGHADYLKREVGSFAGHQWGHPLAINGDLTRHRRVFLMASGQMIDRVAKSVRRCGA